MVEIDITLPDGASRRMPSGTTGDQILEYLPRSLSKNAVALSVDGRLQDLSGAIGRDAAIRVIRRDDLEALELIRHDAAHVMAQAVQDLWPGTQVTIGPVIENGFYYDFDKPEPFHPDDLPIIEAKMREIVQQGAAFSKEVVSRDKAKDVFAGRGERYKVELIDAIPDDQDVSIYHQGGWFDLCRGPHMPTVGLVGDAFKLLRIAGAYWRGDSNNTMLQRIYGTAWASKKDLDAYLARLAEMEKRDHRRLGREMDLFHFQEEAPGAIFWHPKGWTLFRILVDYMRRRQEAAGYVEVNTPDIMDKSLWERSGHWDKFGELMFSMEMPDERTYCCKPMNCPGHVQIFKHGLRSYRDLPLKISEFGKVHRYEPSGSLHGVMRVRHFTQDDAHLFCTQEQITELCADLNNLVLTIYREFGFEDVIIKLADRPPRRVGSDDVWDRAEHALKMSVELAGQTYGLNPGEGSFYGPKLEYTLRDAIGREWQCGTVQVDFNLPGRLGAYYIGPDSAKHEPVMIHRALFGSLERFIGILIEHYAGALPLWLSPVQAIVCTVVSGADEYARSVYGRLRASGLRAEIDLRNEKIGYKVREHLKAKVPVLLVVGNDEATQGTVSIRRLGSGGQTAMTLDEAIQSLLQEGTPPDLRTGRQIRKPHDGELRE